MSAEDLPVQFPWDVIARSKLPLDITLFSIESFWDSLDEKSRHFQKFKSIGSSVGCLKCKTPWIAGLYQSRIESSTQRKLVKSIRKKQRRKNSKLSNHQRNLLYLYRSREKSNVITCKVCKNKTVDKIKPRKKEMKKKNNKNLLPLATMKRTKKKKKTKVGFSPCQSRISRKCVSENLSRTSMNNSDYKSEKLNVRSPENVFPHTSYTSVHNTLSQREQQRKRMVKERKIKRLSQLLQLHQTDTEKSGNTIKNFLQSLF